MTASDEWIGTTTREIGGQWENRFQQERAHLLVILSRADGQDLTYAIRHFLGKGASDCN
jgi:hypothetical protein